MKQLILAAALLVSTCMLAFAGEGSTKAQNEANMKLGRAALTAKIQELEQNLNSRNTQAAESTAADVLSLMRKGMAQTRIQLDLGKKGPEQKAINARYLGLEESVHQYQTLSSKVSANGKQLLEHARSFMKQY